MDLRPSKSPSSLSLPPNSYSSKFHNPNRRSSELTDPIRRSFKDNPFTKTSTAPTPRRSGPSAPPKDYPVRRRDSISCLRECEEKENRTNPGSLKVHSRPRSVSPSTRTMTLPSASNSGKNFMSPTISTASKIIASPRKKLLSESNNHNQPLQPSVTCSDLRSSSSSVRSLCGAFAEQMEADHKDYLAQRNRPISSEKENRRDLNSKQMQIKLLPASKNTKHFMSPTVSAASKISASPRKKILAESNGDLRSSCSSVNNITGGDFATKLHDTKGPVSKKKVAFDQTVCIIPPVVSDPLQENGSLRDDDLECLLSSVNNNLFESREDSEPKSVGENGFTAPYSEPESDNVEGEDVNLNSLSSVLPPLDADHRFLELSCDPKTISLEPAGTIDLCEGEIDHNPLDDGFIFDVFPDTEGTNEADFGKKLSEGENLDSESMITTTKPEQANEVVEGKESLGQHFLTTTLFSIFFVLISFSVIMAINPQVRSYSLIKGPYISMVSEYETAGYSKGSVGLTGDHLRHWGYNFGFMSNIKKVEHDICFQNLTASDKQNAYHDLTMKADDSSYMITNFEILEHTVQFGELLECEEDSGMDASELADEESCAIEANVDQEVAGEAHESEGVEEGVLVEAENIQDGHGLHSAESGELQPVELQPILDGTESGEELKNGGSESKAFTPVEDEKSELDHAQMETMDEMVMDSKSESPLTSENEADESLKTDNMFSVISDYSDGVVVQTVINISLLALTLAIIATLVCRKVKNSTKVATISEEREKEVELYEMSDDVEVSCSTAMSSSYQKDSNEVTSEVQRQHKRKSNKASSDLSNSSVSPSYGSFTSYGMIPSRHRDGVEEMMVTPVRRSSRLRK